MHLPFKQADVERKSGHVFPPQGGCPEGTRGHAGARPEGGAEPVARAGPPEALEATGAPSEPFPDRKLRQACWKGPP